VQARQAQAVSIPGKKDTRDDDEAADLAHEMLSQSPPWDIIADPPLSLTHCLRSEQVAWVTYDSQGNKIWMPYCAGRRKRGEEEDTDF
jgi:hypothetical protein